ncbi:MAG TPA: GNAT family N-acetyltransferase [Bauldia sp.]|nr:GNAT family N-acetyltransferase [Bauldia sp.]
MTAAIEVRRLTEADPDLLREIVAMLPAPEWRGDSVPSQAHLARVLHEGTYIVAALAGRKPAGFASAYRFPAVTAQSDLACIYDVFVAEQWRGQGIGRRMLDRLLADLKADGVSEAWVGTDPDNRAARRLYAAAGACAAEEYVQFEFVFEAPKAARRAEGVRP